MLWLENILGFWICQGCKRFWIECFVIDVRWYSEYAIFLNMLVLQKFVNKVFHHRYLTRFWICLVLWIYQCYTGLCRKHPVIHVWQLSEDLNMQWSWISQGYTWFCVNCILKILNILNVLSSEYAKILNVTGV